MHCLGCFVCGLLWFLGVFCFADKNRARRILITYPISISFFSLLFVIQELLDEVNPCFIILEVAFELLIFPQYFQAHDLIKINRADKRWVSFGLKEPLPLLNIPKIELIGLGAASFLLILVRSCLIGGCFLLFFLQLSSYFLHTSFFGEPAEFLGLPGFLDAASPAFFCIIKWLVEWINFDNIWFIDTELIPLKLYRHFWWSFINDYLVGQVTILYDLYFFALD